jgi:hypothetical protein
MKHISLIACVLLLGCAAGKPFNEEIQSVKVYNRFIPNGTTANINAAFSQPGQYSNVDTSSSTAISISPVELTAALKTATVKKMHQSKVGGITIAGEFIVNGARHNFIYFPRLSEVYDFTDAKRYVLKLPSAGLPKFF